MNHTEILKTLVERHGYKSYLEIGVQNCDNFNAIPCEKKVAVDPEPTGQNKTGRLVKKTSDEFFAKNKQKFDLIFIDGLHHADQVQKDFENSLKALNPGGRIMLHDCNPHKEEITRVPRATKEWTGDVYKFASVISMYMNHYYTVDTDYGCMVVKPKFVDGKYDGFNNIHPLPDIDWKYFTENKTNSLNLITVDQFKAL